MKKAYVGILSGVLALSAVAISAFAAPAGRPVGQQGAQDSSTVEPYQASLDSRAVQGNLSGAVMAGAGNDEVGTEEGLGSELAQPVATMVEPTVETVWGAGYVDSDGDGVCDNLGTRGRLRNGAGARNGRGYGAGRNR